MSITRLNDYDWQRPLIMALMPLILITIFAVFVRTHVVWTVLFFIAILVALYGVVLFLRTRAQLTVTDENQLLVRRYFRTVAVSPDVVVGVKHIFNGRSPDFVIKRRSGLGVYVPTSRIMSGHSTLFTWLHEIDGASYDAGAEKIMSRLEAEGLIDGTT
ncbi:MAG: hypothetical protein ACRCWS_00085 [Propionibacteriaceae bacterium]